jgi:hypothetical protein
LTFFGQARVEYRPGMATRTDAKSFGLDLSMVGNPREAFPMIPSSASISILTLRDGQQKRLQESRASKLSIDRMPWVGNQAVRAPAKVANRSLHDVTFMALCSGKNSDVSEDL